MVLDKKWGFEKVYDMTASAFISNDTLCLIYILTPQLM